MDFGIIEKIDFSYSQKMFKKRLVSDGCMNNSLAANIYGNFLPTYKYDVVLHIAICYKHILCKHVCILHTFSLQVLKSFYIDLFQITLEAGK